MKRSASLIKVICIFVVIVSLFSCDTNVDQREQTRKALGEPDEIISQDYGTYKSELWVYARSDINVVYQFNKSASGCGGSGEWYIYRRYYADYHFGYELYDPPPVITHTPVKSAPAGKRIIIYADVQVNKKAKFTKEVKSVQLFYKPSPDSVFQKVTMSLQDSLYTGEIPSEFVTVSGVDYMIKATGDGTHWSTLPKSSYYIITITPETSGQVQKAVRAESTMDYEDILAIPEPGISPPGLSPVNP